MTHEAHPVVDFSQMGTNAHQPDGCPPGYTRETKEQKCQKEDDLVQATSVSAGKYIDRLDLTGQAINWDTIARRNDSLFADAVCGQQFTNGDICSSDRFTINLNGKPITVGDVELAINRAFLNGGIDIFNRDGVRIAVVPVPGVFNETRATIDIREDQMRILLDAILITHDEQKALIEEQRDVRREQREARVAALEAKAIEFAPYGAGALGVLVAVWGVWEGGKRLVNGIKGKISVFSSTRAQKRIEKQDLLWKQRPTKQQGSARPTPYTASRKPYASGQVEPVIDIAPSTHEEQPVAAEENLRSLRKFAQPGNPPFEIIDRE